MTLLQSYTLVRPITPTFNANDTIKHRFTMAFWYFNEMQTVRLINSGKDSRKSSHSGANHCTTLPFMSQSIWQSITCIITPRKGSNFGWTNNYTIVLLKLINHSVTWVFMPLWGDKWTCEDPIRPRLLCESSDRLKEAGGETGAWLIIL